MARKNQNDLRSGEWNTICDVCGWKYKASDLRKRWDGFMVCEPDWEKRHDQDFLRAVEDDQSVPWTRAEGSDSFAAAGDINNATVLPVPGGTFNSNNGDL